ncbi:MAG: hypothetical protein IKY67_14695 [Paludibacteraceae bacterium]|nr:hypothetical protein [Paludibacteraceae bacterium]
MKFNFILSIITLFLVSLIAFGFYSWCRCEDLKLLITLFGGISLFFSIGATLGISFEDSRKTVNVKILSNIFSLLLLISNVIFCCLTSFSVPFYIITNGILLLIWCLCCYGIVKS